MMKRLLPVIALMAMAWQGVAAAEVLPGSEAGEGEVSSHVPMRGMAQLGDDELESVQGQGLIWTDKISGSELAGSNAFSTPFNFYRMGLDGELALNTNIAKLQLGCGGVNDALNAAAGCDIDIDYASLMGKANASTPGNPLSAFILKRPYLELAIKNDGGTTTREIAGIKIGAQSADGAISAGRRYESGQTNQENMLNNACAGADVGPGALGCHSGINSVSGFLGAELSLQMRVKASICGGVVTGTPGTPGAGCFGIPIGLDAWGCIGKLDNPNCSSYSNTPLYSDIGGTRMQVLGLKAALLDLSGNGLSGALTALISSAYASLNADLRLVHKLVFDNTGDFFISFQREPIAYPRYSKVTPAADAAVVNDGCKTAAFGTARCNSAYAVPANTGWWLNAPSVKLTNVNNPDANLYTLSIGDALSLLAAPGKLIDQAEFQLTPSKNCYGATRFC